MRRVIVKSREQPKKDIYRSFGSLPMISGLAEMLLQSFFIGKVSVASVAVKGRSMHGRVSQMLVQSLFAVKLSVASVAVK